MKIRIGVLFLLVGLSIISCTNNASKLAIKNNVDSVSYVMGVLDGERLSQSFAQAGLEGVIDVEVYINALMDAANEKELRMNPDSNKMVVQNFFREFQTNQMMSIQDTSGMAPAFEPAASYIDSVSYLMGAGDGKGLLSSFTRSGLDTMVRVDIYLDALAASAKKLEVKIEGQANMQMVNDFFESFKEKELMSKFGANKTAGEEFLAKNKALETVTETASGLQYEIITEGNGPRPAFNDKVKVHYTGTLLDGTVFDSSVERGEPAVFGVGQVIKGWTEALQLMPVGSKWKLYIPYDIAYGTRDMGEIKPYSMLIFEVELLEIVK
ncbi:MAG: peptidylprolyl isomerase [Bacteroidetes bacterium HGW-Bacteroidetes-4]|jgi:FKBP-type peptidyl-prolyl cis-trans isomerase|nr:MAG: peptidylprolyl isomerase [Bacteroidetes bacterium HGW-Bacteroidetes-4]